jgi:hypothetical protein
MKKALQCFAAAAAMTLIAAGGAMAQTYPTSIVGTWTIRANDTQPFTFTVSSQSSDAPCALIGGLMGAPNDTIVGYYCPATGGVSFLRNSSNTGATYQVFTGGLSWTGSKTYMTGSFSNFAGGNDTGSFGFTASTPPS